jgi:hypothetical protein
LTPREFVELQDGYLAREDREMQRLAWLASNIINGSGFCKRKVRPEHLYKPLHRKEKQEPGRAIFPDMPEWEEKDWIKELRKKRDARITSRKHDSSPGSGNSGGQQGHQAS